MPGTPGLYRTGETASSWGVWININTTIKAFGSQNCQPWTRVQQAGPEQLSPLGWSTVARRDDSRGSLDGRRAATPTTAVSSTRSSWRGQRVRPLAERGMGNMRGPFGDLAAAYGAVVGTPENAQELMRHDETVLVFPGGGREIAKFKGEEHRLNWQGRSGFARVAIANGYPIVPVGLVGGDDIYRSFFSRDSRLGQFSLALSEKITGRKDMAMPLVHGIGPTLIPRPQRMYLRFGTPIDTTKPADVADDDWVASIKQTTQTSLEAVLTELLTIRADDPYRTLDPLARRRAAHPLNA